MLEAVSSPDLWTKLQLGQVDRFSSDTPSLKAAVRILETRIPRDLIAEVLTYFAFQLMSSNRPRLMGPDRFMICNADNEYSIVSIFSKGREVNTELEEFGVGFTKGEYRKKVSFSFPGPGRLEACFIRMRGAHVCMDGNHTLKLLVAECAIFSGYCPCDELVVKADELRPTNDTESVQILRYFGPKLLLGKMPNLTHLDAPDTGETIAFTRSKNLKTLDAPNARYIQIDCSKRLRRVQAQNAVFVDHSSIFLNGWNNVLFWLSLAAHLYKHLPSSDNRQIGYGRIGNYIFFCVQSVLVLLSYECTKQLLFCKLILPAKGIRVGEYCPSRLC